MIAVVVLWPEENPTRRDSLKDLCYLCIISITKGETYELLVNFNVLEQEYGLYIPLDPFFIVGKLKDKGATLLEDDDFDRIQPLIESELEKNSY